MLTLPSAATTSQVVVVKVRPNRREYSLHKNLPIHHSGRFQCWMTGRSCSSPITLDRVSTEVFELFVDWLYEKRLPLGLNSGQWVTSYCYILANYLSVNHLKTALMDIIFDIFSYYVVDVSTDWVCHIFEDLQKKDTLPQLAINSIRINNTIAQMGVGTLARIGDLPKEYLVRIICKLRQLSQLPGEEKRLNREDYSMLACLPDSTDDQE